MCSLPTGEPMNSATMEEQIGNNDSNKELDNNVMPEEVETAKIRKTGDGLAKLAHVVSEEQRDAEGKEEFPLLQQGGLTAEQLAAIQTSMAFPSKGVAVADLSGQLHVDEGIDQSLQMSIQPQMDALQNLSPDELQAILTGQMYITTAPPAGPEDAPSAEEKKAWWDEKDEAELFKMIHSDDYRLSMTGSSKLDWRKLEEYFGRSQNALRKKHWLMSKGFHGPYSGQNTKVVQGSAGAKLNGRKRWTKSETKDILRLVEDEAYRVESGILSEFGHVDWKKLGEKFNCDPVVSRRKYRNLLKKIQAEDSHEANDKGKRKHHRKKVAYKWMIVAVLDTFLDQEGPAPDIFDAIEANEDFRTQLDYSIAPGTKNIHRWKIQVRKVLSSEKIFVNTGKKIKHETVWKIDPTSLESVRTQAKQRMGDLSQNGSAHLNLGLLNSQPDSLKDGVSNG